MSNWSDADSDPEMTEESVKDNQDLNGLQEMKPTPLFNQALNWAKKKIKKAGPRVFDWAKRKLFKTPQAKGICILIIITL